MKLNPLILSSTFLVISFASANAATVSVPGSAPSTNIIAENHVGSNTGVRELSWRSATIHSQTGQSFTASGSGSYTLDSIFLYQTTTESYGDWASTSYSIKVFLGTASDANSALATFDYDATGLGSVSNNSWLQFDSDSAVTLTDGTQYSFLITNGSEDSDHRVNFLRDRDAGATYTGGGELRPANTANDYDILNWATDPWDVSAPQGAGGPITELTNSDLHFYVTGTAIPEPTAGVMLLLSGAFLLRRRR